MKKTILIAFAVALCLAMSMSVFAEVTINTVNTTNIAGANFVPSTNVSIRATSDTVNYCATSMHSNAASAAAGREWASATNSASSIFFKQPAPAAIEGCSDASTVPSGMTAQ